MIIFEKLFQSCSLLLFAPFPFLVGLCKYIIGMVLVLLTMLIAIWTDK